MNTPKRTLGRGLGELMLEVTQVDKPLSTSTDRAFLQLPLETLSCPPPAGDQPAATPPETLLQSLKTHGILQPILARKQDAGYIVIDGCKRLQAARELGFRTIPALVLNSPDADAAVLAAEANRRQPDNQPLQEQPAPAACVAEPPLVTFLPSPDMNPDPVFTAASTQPPATPAAETPAAAPERWRPATAAPQPPLPAQQDVWLVPLAAAAGAFILGIAGTLWLTYGEGSRTASTSSRAPLAKITTAPGTASSLAPSNTPALPPTPPPPPQRKTPAWMSSLSVEGLTTLVTNETVIVTFDKPVFARYSTMAPDAGSVLKRLAAALITTEAPLHIRVCGHTDDTPVRSGGAFKDNFSVGLARATQVVEYLKREGNMATADFTAASVGDANPPYPNDTPENRLRNRTVTIVLSERTTQP